MSHQAPMLYRIRHYLLVGCAALWIGAFIATHVPAERLPELGAGDITLHAAGYFLLTIVFLATLTGRGVERLRRVLTALPVMLAYGALDEITQPLVNRYAAWSDWIANAAGAAGAVIVWELLLAAARRRRRASGADGAP